MRKQFRGGLLLALAALIWGMAFSAQSEAGKHMGPFAFTAARSFITFFALLLFEAVGSRGRRQAQAVQAAPLSAYIKVGAPLGAVMFAASALQQLGLTIDPSAAKSGFITALYIVIVPILGLIFFRRRVGVQMWLGVALSLVGLALLCVKDGFTIGAGDLVTLACAVMFAVHIVAVGRFAGGLSAPRLCCVQFGLRACWRSSSPSLPRRYAFLTCSPAGRASYTWACAPARWAIRCKSPDRSIQNRRWLR